MKTIARSIVALSLVVASMAHAAERKSNTLKWGDSPEAYFLTADERKTWTGIKSNEEAEKFIAEYWAKHGEAFRNEVQARIEAADKHFGLNEKKGSETAKGRVFMLLGAPDQQQTQRTSARAGFGTGPGGPNSIERAAITVTDWVYKSMRLPKELGVPELTVRFQTDVARGYQTIENPGLVEPYLKRIVEYQMARFAEGNVAPAQTMTPGKEVPAQTAPAAPSVDPGLWSAAPNLNGAFFTGESFISPTEKTFYAYSFYLPKAVAALAAPQKIVMAGSIKDATGTQVAAFRQNTTPASYDAAGDRYADGSVELPPGKYNGVFAMYAEDGSSLLATARTEFEVPEIAITRVSRPLLTSKIDTLESQAAFDPFTFVATKYAVKGSNTFSKAEPVGFFTFIANPTVNPEPNMSFRMKVLRGSTVVEQSPMMPAALQQTGPHTYLLATRFEPNSFSPGHYKLEITVKDMNAPKDSEAYMKGYVRNVEFDVTN